MATNFRASLPLRATELYFLAPKPDIFRFHIESLKKGGPLIALEGASNYPTALVEAQFARRPYLRLSRSEAAASTDAVMQWAEYERICWERVMQGTLVANAFMLRKSLIRKTNLAACVQKHMRRCPTSPLHGYDLGG